MIAYYTAISILNIIALLVLGYIILKSDVVSIRVRRFFHLSVLTTIIVIIAEVGTVYWGNTSVQYRIPHIIANVIGFSISPFIPLLIGCSLGYRCRKGTLLFWLPSTVNLILSFLSSQSSIIFWVSSENVYYRGRFFWVSLVSYAVGIIYLFLQTLVAAKQYQNSNRLILFILFLFVVLGTSIQVLLPQLYLSWLCISFAIGLYYIYFCELYHQIDGLTELLNRRSYESYLNKIQNKKNVTIFIFDIDDFKSVNDQYGHPFGDFCIMAISSCIKEVFYKTGLCFRTGGDEFCVISETQNHYAIQRAYHRFLREIELKRKKEKRLPMVSVGYSCYCSESGSIDEAISEADKRMYYFKQRRKATSSSPSQSEIDSNNLI